MADKTMKQPENASGRWYVDASCALCRNCLEEAPSLLQYSQDQAHVYFARQPATPEEEIAAGRAMDVCPTLAIGDDGEL
ncbi:MAG: ferredoxin [Chthoniobacterales bacterium]|jgi:ferredoxin